MVKDGLLKVSMPNKKLLVSCHDPKLVMLK